MCHKLPWPLQPRVFSVLVIEFRPMDPLLFFVVQLPVDLSEFDGPTYSNGRVQAQRGDEASKVERRPCVIGYVSAPMHNQLSLLLSVWLTGPFSAS